MSKSTTARRQRHTWLWAYVGPVFLLLVNYGFMTRQISQSSKISTDLENLPLQQHSDKEPAASTARDDHIVVAHCTKNLTWLNQLHDYNPLVCTYFHIHIYSRCGMQIDVKNVLSAIENCTTLHRIRNHVRFFL